MKILKFSTIEKFLGSELGKRLLNYTYSFGAAIVILGALFKIIHLDYANEMLAVGMITEAIIFCILGFDRPSASYNWEEVFPVLKSKKEEDRPNFNNLSGNEGAGGTILVGGGLTGADLVGSISPMTLPNNLTTLDPAQQAGLAQATAQTPTGATMPSGGGYAVPQSFMPAGLQIADEDIQNFSESIKKLSDAAQQFTKMAEHVNTFGQTANTLASVSETMLGAYKGISDNSEGIVNNSIDYINQMENINRNLSGLNTIYEIQLKSLSSQIDAIDKVNTSLNRIKEMYEHSAGDTGRFREETERMSQQLAALNAVYGRILNAMSLNMYGGGNNRY